MRFSQRTLLTLVAWMMAMGMWAQTETLLTTIESRSCKDYTTGSFTTTDGKAIVSFSSFVYNMGSDWGWYSNAERVLTVSGGDGYTVTMCRFYTKDMPAGFDVTAPPYKIYLNKQKVYSGPNESGTCLGQYGVTKIEVYGGETVEVTNDGLNAYSFAMPGGDAKVFLEYYPTATTSTTPVAVADLHADDDKDLVADGATNDGTLVYARTLEAVAPALDAFSEEVPTAVGLTTAGTVYVWYRILSDSEHSDSEILGPIEVNIAEPLHTHDLIFSAANIHRIEDGKAVVKIDRRYRTGDIANGKIQAVKLGQKVTITPVAGYEFTNNINIDLAEDGSASMEMPDDETTINYELVRDMTYRVSAEMGAGRIRIQKNQESVFEFVDPTAILPIVTDTIGDTPLNMTLHTDYEYTLQEPDGEGWKDTDVLSVGVFRIRVSGKTLYEGNAYTLPFELFQGYEIVVPAKSYVTYYKDEALYDEADDIKLYTITDVGETSVTISELDVVPSYTPLLVYNSSNAEKTALLIPTDEPVNGVDAADEFNGTLEDVQMNASSDAANYYILQNNAFVRVTTSGTISAHRCWLEIGNGAEARRMDIVLDGEATGVDIAHRTDADAEIWYDLNGRRLNAAPMRKGIYVVRSAKDGLQGKSGKKVIIQ